jgi:hypothetical protein
MSPKALPGDLLLIHGGRPFFQRLQCAAIERVYDGFLAKPAGDCNFFKEAAARLADNARRVAMRGRSTATAARY